MLTLAPESKMASITAHASELLLWRGLNDCLPVSTKTQSDLERCVAHRWDSVSTSSEAFLPSRSMFYLQQTCVHMRVSLDALLRPAQGMHATAELSADSVVHVASAIFLGLARRGLICCIAGMSSALPPSVPLPAFLQTFKASYSSSLGRCPGTGFEPKTTSGVTAACRQTKFAPEILPVPTCYL